MKTPPTDNPFLTVILDIVDAAGKREAFETDPHFHLKVSHSNHNPLDIQSLPAKYPYLSERRHILVANIITVERTSLPMPNMIMTDQGLPIEVHSLEGYWLIVSQGLSERTEIDQERLAEAQAFLQKWATQLREEGWIAIAQTQQSHP
jgi:hypothetical protein